MQASWPFKSRACILHRVPHKLKFWWPLWDSSHWFLPFPVASRIHFPNGVPWTWYTKFLLLNPTSGSASRRTQSKITPLSAFEIVIGNCVVYVSGMAWRDSQILKPKINGKINKLYTICISYHTVGKGEPRKGKWEKWRWQNIILSRWSDRTHLDVTNIKIHVYSIKCLFKRTKYKFLDQ